MVNVKSEDVETVRGVSGVAVAAVPDSVKNALVKLADKSETKVSIL